jgi:hypothetical protein
MVRIRVRTNITVSQKRLEYKHTGATGKLVGVVSIEVRTRIPMVLEYEYVPGYHGTIWYHGTLPFGMPYHMRYTCTYVRTYVVP